MSDMSSLSDLARIVPASSLASSNPKTRRRALAGFTARLDPKGQKRSVGELLGIVLTLSARTRRMALPPCSIDLDVFAPDGQRSVRLSFGSKT